MDAHTCSLDLANVTFYPAYTGEKYRHGMRTGLVMEKSESGVYFIRENGILVYVGMGVCLKKSLYRHFHSWVEYRGWAEVPEEARIKRVTYPKDERYTVGAMVTDDKASAHVLEKRMILKHNPRDNGHKMNYYALTYKDELVHKDHVLREERGLEQYDFETELTTIIPYDRLPDPPF